MADIKEDRERSNSRSPLRRSRSRSRSPRRNRNDRQRFMGGRRIIIRNIPYEVRWQELKDMFRKEVGDVTYVEMLETPEGKSKGVAVVEFKDPEHAKKAIEDFHQKKIKERAIIVREEREKDRQEFLQHKSMKEGGAAMMAGMGAGGLGLGGGIPPGVNPHVLNQLGIDGPITSTVFVANLDYKVTWWKLKDVFKLAGNVIKAEIKEDKNGQSRGMGIVVFEHPMEAVQAVSMFNGQTLYERNMIVRIDKGGPQEEKLKLPSGLKSIGMGLGSGGAPLTNISQLGGGYGLGGGGGLLGLGGFGGGNSGLGLLGPGGGAELGLAGLGGLGLGNSSPLGAGSGGMGFGSDLGGYGGSSKYGLADAYSGLGGSSFNGSGSLSGLGGLGPSLSSLSGGLGLGGGMGDGLGMGRDRMGYDRLGGMGGLDRLRDMGGRDDDRRKTRPDNCTVIVKNLPYSVNWQALKEFFRDAGDVKFAEIVMDKGKSTGIGYVRFSNESDALRAVNSKNRSKMERRNIDVSLHRN